MTPYTPDIWSPADCDTMTDRLRAAALMIEKRSKAAGLRAWPLPAWMLDCISGNQIAHPTRP